MCKPGSLVFRKPTSPPVVVHNKSNWLIVWICQTIVRETAMQSPTVRALFLLLGLSTVSFTLFGQTRNVKQEIVPFHKNLLSMVRLLANPEKFDGSKVTISGYLHLHFEDAGLYLSKSNADYLCKSNALWVEISDSVRAFPIRITGQEDTVRTHKYFDFKHVTLSGTFRSANHGHMGAFPGAIESVDVLIEDRQWYDGPKELWKETGHGLVPIDGPH